MGQVLREGVPFAAGNVLGAVPLNLPTVAVSLGMGLSAAGEFQAASKLFLALGVIPGAVGAVAFPHMAAKVGPSPSEAWRRFHQGNGLLLLVGIWAGLVLAVLSGPLVGLLFGDGYRGAGPVLMILAAGSPAFFLNHTASQALGAVGRQGNAVLAFHFLGLRPSGGGALDAGGLVDGAGRRYSRDNRRVDLRVDSLGGPGGERSIRRGRRSLLPEEPYRPSRPDPRDILKILLIDLNSVSEDERGKARALSREPGVDLTLLRPHAFRDGIWVRRAGARDVDDGYRTVVGRLAGKSPNRVVFLSGLREAFDPVPDVVHVLTDENFWLTTQV
ncbi:MAG: hypothetical protein HYR98_07275, partial [Nitrospirae bacterium]|nr:hypothetical protein [Nitrospirota bacterium]